MARPRVIIGADSLRKAASGIGRVARLMARVLAEEAGAGRLEAEAVVLSDPVAPHDLGIPVRTARGSRLWFTAAMHHEAVRGSYFLYDFAGIARAHARLPLLRRPSLVWIHGIEIWEDARADRLRRADAADALLANTEYTRRRAVGLHPSLARARLCWLATEEDEAAPVRAADVAPAVLILSRLDLGGGYKGHRELVACWSEVVKAVPSARLLIAGDGPGMQAVRALVAVSSAREQIEFLGFVPDEALEPLWNRATLFAMPSRGEGFGLAYVEAMRHGVPVIGSVHDAAVEVNAHGESGYNVDLDRHGELPARLVALLRDPTEAARLGAGARARWEKHFRFSAFRDRLRPLLWEFLRSR